MADDLNGQSDGSTITSWTDRDPDGNGPIAATAVGKPSTGEVGPQRPFGGPFEFERPDNFRVAAAIESAGRMRVISRPPSSSRRRSREPAPRETGTAIRDWSMRTRRARPRIGGWLSTLTARWPPGSATRTSRSIQRRPHSTTARPISPSSRGPRACCRCMSTACCEDSRTDAGQDPRAVGRPGLRLASDEHELLRRRDRRDPAL